MSEVKRYAFKLTALSSMCGGRIELVEYTGEGMPYVLASDYDQLKAENERLKCVVERLHAELFDEQQRRFEGNRLASEEYHTDTLELQKQLDEARELLAEVRTLECRGVDMAHLDAWLEANKP